MKELGLIESLVNADAVLSSICNGRVDNVNFIEGYTDELGKKLEAYGYIELIDHGNYVEPKPTAVGKSFYAAGGFDAEYRKRKETDAAHELDKEFKTCAIRTNKITTAVAIIALIISLIGVLMQVL